MALRRRIKVFGCLRCLDFSTALLIPIPALFPLKSIREVTRVGTRSTSPFAALATSSHNLFSHYLNLTTQTRW